MTPALYRTAAAIFLLGIALAFLHQRWTAEGRLEATQEYLPQVTILKTLIEQSDAQAKATEQTQKENHHAIETEYAVYTNRLTDYYERRLLEARSGDPAGTRIAAADTQETNGASGQPMAAGRYIEFESACAEDALKVTQFQSYVIKNRIPVE